MPVLGASALAQQARSEWALFFAAGVGRTIGPAFFVVHYCSRRAVPACFECMLAFLVHVSHQRLAGLRRICRAHEVPGCLAGLP